MQQDGQRLTAKKLADRINSAGGDQVELSEIKRLLAEGLPASENKRPTIDAAQAAAWLLATDADRSPNDGPDEAPSD